MHAPVIERSVLTVAGSDSCGGAGIQADLSTFAAFGVYGASVVTAVTARNTLGVRAVERISDRLVVAQIEAVLEDLPIRAIKTGMLPSVAGIAILGELLERQSPRLPLVVDPVVVEADDEKLTGEAALQAVQDHLFPLATLVTPNLEEAAVLAGMAIDSAARMQSAAERLLERGAAAVLLKGGRFENDVVTDLLVTPQGSRAFRHAAFPGRFHGTGCVLASAVAAGLALERPLEVAVEDAIDYLQSCLQDSVSAVSGRLALLGHGRRRA